jgi:DNA-binding SARP family transcriptional activator
LLWENSPDPRGALRWCLSRLKTVLDSGDATRLIAEDDALWVEPDAWEVDARRLRDLARAPDQAETTVLESAVAQLTGPFLADLDLNDAIRFESWRLGEEKSLTQARAVVFAEALRRHAGLPEARLRLAHVWVQQDPLDERPHIAIVESLIALGRKREALAHYERCAQMLRRNGSVPGPALEKARVAIGPLGNSGSALSGPQPASAPGSLAGPSVNVPVTVRPPIAGRASELARFAALAAAPDRRLRLLVGEPGIGKTRLLEEMGDALAARGWRVLQGRAFEA